MSGEIYSYLIQNNSNLNFCLFITALLSWFLFHIFERYLWLNQQDKYCRKFNGVCENCNCWSCTKKNLDHNRVGDNDEV